jgi:hypothetical protein
MLRPRVRMRMPFPYFKGATCQQVAGTMNPLEDTVK